MTNKVGKVIFQRAGELNVPVGFMCMKVHVKFGALFRVSRAQFPYLDLSLLLSHVVSHFGANRVMWSRQSRIPQVERRKPDVAFEAATNVDCKQQQHMMKDQKGNGLALVAPAGQASLQ
ncbi:hypothetical protein JHK87_051756 [Glycine soja]|nr:hypothetical protein JHK87_051756 [Glycine soja]